ncbi:MAG TPA: AbrB/MazE/SpoVT family DNA-binding domain-containing protein [Candidatus Marinimicrobia bacterium]|nr:AbrB/MazE/SpoVT family DNA-binding domain-containing protein [Candidatus Neomarinimicrobiota bacterium]HQE95660.1 AbrB/MazE/SpoVT family DNA-binding domain-containing protein [Candidatus Neomarinimicrobiota bacterium]HQH56232.1 AbrB/MazE/SpoVT family DNA-binding domain-containing protein [Candidatus Neomarinimicrobiota bacterium]HQK11863.1 AbrB/MazE/SpoVT family DNA-binding domain-containing protein [Candidatus Neomarinimicrobiota bacterium]
MRRKIVRVGASLCVLLPKEVVRAMGWDFEDEINLILDEENEVVILRNLKNQPIEKKTMMEHFDQFLENYGKELGTLVADHDPQIQ